MADYTVTLPCRIGDRVFAINRRGGNRCVTQGSVSEIYFIGEDMKPVITVRNVCRGDVCRNIFLSYEEAKAALDAQGRR